MFDGSRKGLDGGYEMRLVEAGTMSTCYPGKELRHPGVPEDQQHGFLRHCVCKKSVASSSAEGKEVLVDVVNQVVSSMNGPSPSNGSK